MGLLGWVIKSAYHAQLDGVVPPEAVEIIVRAICRSYRMTFFYPVPKRTSSEWESTEGEQRCKLWSPWLPKLFGKSIPLVSTTVPESAKQLFDADLFDWHLQGQIVLVSSADGPPPPLTYWQMTQLRKRCRWNAEQLGLLPDIVGMFLPAVDGDFAQFVAFEDRFWFQILESLEAECRSAGVEWRVVDEADLKKGPWVVDGQ